MKYQLYLRGYVGGYDFDAEYVNYILAQNENKRVDVLIDSLGGAVNTALSIAAAFERHGDVHVHFVGMNASAATIASMGAKEITIDSNAMYLVHKVSSLVFEWQSMNADQLQELIDKCKKQKCNQDKMDGNIAEMYAKRCKKETQCLLDLMKEGGWLTAKEAKEWGFVDKIVAGEQTKKPVLTNELVASMEAAGIPVPNVKTQDENIMTQIKDFFKNLFAPQQNITTAEEETSSAPKQTTEETTIQNTNNMKKTFQYLCALLAVEAFNLIEGNASMSEGQLQTLEDKFKANEDEINALKAQADKDKARIDELNAQVEELKKQPADDSPSVINNGKEKPEAEDEYSKNLNEAKELFNMLK